MFPASTLQSARRLVPETRGAFAWIIVHHSRSLCVPPMELHTITCVCSSEKCVISGQTSLSIIQEIVQVILLVSHYILLHSLDK